MIAPLEAHRKVVGNACLHRELLVPERFFLRRNLSHILDSHERLCSGHAAQDGGLSALLASGHQDRVETWRYPSAKYAPEVKEIMDRNLSGQKAMLRIDSLQIRGKNSTKRRPKRSTVEETEDDLLDFLPDPDVLFSAPCAVEVSVHSTGEMKQRLIQQSRPATVRQYPDGKNTTYFVVELDSPIDIRSDDLYTTITDRNSGFGSGMGWKQGIGKAYSLELSIQCQSLRHAEQLLSRLEKSSVRCQDHRDAVLKAGWDKFPDCPPVGHLLPLRRTKGHKGRQPVGDFGVDICMGWGKRKRDSSVLEQWNRQLRSSEMPIRQLPTPTSSEDMEKSPAQPVITYIYRESGKTRGYSVTGLTCPLCPGAPAQPSFDRLRLHCLMHHDHLNFETVVASESQGQPSSSIPRYRIEITLANQPRDSLPESDGKDKIFLNWVAPDRPFEVSAQLRGSGTWLPNQYQRRRGRGRPPRAGRGRAAAPSGVPRVVRRRPAPEDVEDLPDQRPRKRIVPDVPNVNFFHRVSKKRLEPGTEVSDSDEDIDEDWLVERYKQDLAKLGLSPKVLEFESCFAAHMARERPGSCVLVREGLVRFVRRHGEELQDQERAERFCGLLERLREYRIIDGATEAYCKAKVDRGSLSKVDPESSTTMGGNAEAQAILRASPSRPKDKGKLGAIGNKKPDAASSDPNCSSKGKKEDASSSTTVTTAKHGLCTCGKPAFREHAAIACANLVSLLLPLLCFL